MLTAVAIKLAMGRAKPYKMSDARGLHLLVTPTGVKYWWLNYQHLGKRKTLALGELPHMGLA